MVSVAFYFPDIGVTVRVLAITLFVFLTAPVSAHMIGRAGYQVGVKFWKGTVQDDLKDKYRGTFLDS